MNSFFYTALVGGVVSLLVLLGGFYSVGECSIKGYCTTRRVIISVIAGIIGALLFLGFIIPML